MLVPCKEIYRKKMSYNHEQDPCYLDTISNQGFQNWTGLRGWTVKTGNPDENWFFKSKEPNFLLIS